MKLRSLLLLSVLLTAGCASAVVQVREGTSTIEADDGVAVIFSRAFSPETSQATGREMVTCITDAIRWKIPDARSVTADEFLGAAFPDLTPDAAPLSVESLQQLVNDQEFRGRVETLRVRYLVLVGGGTVQPEPWGGGVFGGAGRGGGGFGLWVWKRESTLSASIFDLREGRSLGRVEAKVTGRPWFTVILIFPLGIPSFTESWACNKLGSGVVEFLRGNERPAR